MTDFSALKLLTKADAAAIFGVCTKTIDNYIREGRLPAPVPFASREYWHPQDFREFLDSTFRRGARDDSERPAAGSDAVQSLDEAVPSKPKSASVPHPRVRDSNPVVRQQARQQSRLRALNEGR